MNLLFLFIKPIVPERGGVQRVTDILAKGFIRHGHGVYFLCTTPTEPIDEAYPYTAKQLILRQACDTGQFLEIIRSFHIDLIINQDFTPESAMLLESLPSDIKAVSVFHSLPFATYKNERRILKAWRPRGLKRNLFKVTGITVPWLIRNYYIHSQRTIFKQLIDCSDKYCLLSERYIERITERIPHVTSGKLVAINNPIAIRRPENTLHKQNVLLFVGRIEMTSKNVMDFIKVWQLLADRAPGWKAIVVGDGSDLNYLKRHVRENGIQRIEFAGQRNDVEAYFEKADFICMTSFYEGWGMALVEGMVHGCIPVCYGTFGAAYDIIDDGECGWVTVPYDVEQMADKIQSLIDDDRKRRSFSRKAREKVESFSSEKIVRQWENLFLTLTK